MNRTRNFLIIGIIGVAIIATGIGLALIGQGPRSTYEGVPRAAHGSDGAPILGDPEAPLILSYFADFTNLESAQFAQTLNKLVENYVRPGQLQIVFRLVPDPASLYSSDAGVAALCAHQQNAFWEYQDRLFETFLLYGMEAYLPQNLRISAAEAGADPAALMECFNMQTANANSDAYQLLDIYANTFEAVGGKQPPLILISVEGGELQWIVNPITDEPIEGAVSYDLLEDVFDAELAKLAP